MELSNEGKIAVLLNRLDFHTKEIHRREETETKLFEWSTALLLAVFAVIIALSDRSNPLPYSFIVKSIAILFVIIPTGVFIYRIISGRTRTPIQAEVIEQIEDQLHLFNDGYYIDEASLYPQSWKGNLAKSMMRRKTPVYYGLIMAFMTIGVVATIWLIL